MNGKEIIEYMFLIDKAGALLLIQRKQELPPSGRGLLYPDDFALPELIFLCR